MSNMLKNTVVPRNPVARSPLLRKGGVHEKTATAKRQQCRDAIRGQLDNWREDVAFEAEVHPAVDVRDEGGE
jgi:hypothetical protein